METTQILIEKVLDLSAPGSFFDSGKGLVTQYNQGVREAVVLKDQEKDISASAMRPLAIHS